MFRVFFTIQLLILGLTANVSPVHALEPASSSYCFRKYLEGITTNEHRPERFVRITREHVLRSGMMYKHATFEEQVNYLLNNVQGLQRPQAEFILKSILEHPQAGPHTRVVFGGSRVRGNAKVASDLDVGVYGFANNPLNKLIKKVNERVAKGEFTLSLETTKIMDQNYTETIPLILSPEEFFLRTGTRAHTAEELKEFAPSGFISVGADGSIVHVPPPGSAKPQMLSH